MYVTSNLNLRMICNTLSHGIAGVEYLRQGAVGAAEVHTKIAPGKM